MNVTLSLDDRLLERARKMAARQGTSLNKMIRRLLEEATAVTSRKSMVDNLERLWAKERGDSGGQKWKREDLYDRTILR